MKKIFIPIIAGVIFLAVGICFMVYGFTRDDFDAKAYSLENYEKDIREYENNLFNQITIMAEVENLEILPTEDDFFTFEGKKSESLCYEYTIENNELIIDQKWKDGIKSFFTLNTDMNITTPFIIKVPNEILNKITIDVNIGDVDIKGINIDQMYLDIETGDLNINECEINDLEFIVKCGNSDIEKTTSKIITGSVDVGDLDFISVNTETITADVSTGSCHFKGLIENNGDFSCDVGDLKLDLDGSNYRINGVGSGSAIITADVNVGDFKFDYE